MSWSTHIAGGQTLDQLLQVSNRYTTRINARLKSDNDRKTYALEVNKLKQRRIKTAPGQIESTPVTLLSDDIDEPAALARKMFKLHIDALNGQYLQT